MTKAERIRKYNEFMGVCAEIIPANVLDAMGFFTAPASTKYHGAYTGGLFDHSLKVAEELVALTKRLGLNWDTPQSPRIVGMYHDLCKCDDYVFDNDVEKWIRRPDIYIPGHGDKSVILAQQFINLTWEEVSCIRWHMGAYETDPKMWTYYGNAIERYPNVLFTHTADMVASKINGI
jgi:hypothetical protein